MNWLKSFAAYKKIDRVSSISNDSFTTNYGFNSKPLVITGLVPQWKAFKLWNYDFLNQRFGNRMIESYRVKDRKDMLLSDYLTYIKSTNDNVPYYVNSCQLHLNTDLEDHYSVPDFLKCWYKSKENEMILSWLFLGATNTRSRFHIDPWRTSAWNAVISGKKFWYFFPPDFKKIDFEEDFDPFKSGEFPAFKISSPQVCVQEPGDLIFVPSGWWHAAFNAEDGISLTENFINNTNYNEVLKYFSSRGSTTAFDKLSGIVERNIKS